MGGIIQVTLAWALSNTTLVLFIIYYPRDRRYTPDGAKSAEWRNAVLCARVSAAYL